jgi:predicted PurR-regulated permease PerM
MPAENPPLLTPAQRKLVGFALAFAALSAIGALCYFIFAGVALFVATFSNVIWPLAVAGILALILRPVVSVLEHRLKIKRPLAVVVLYFLFVLVVAGCLLAVVPALVGQILDFAAYVPTLWERSLSWGEEHFPEWLEVMRRYMENPHIKGVVDALTDQVQNLTTMIAPSLKQAGAGIFGFFGFIVLLAIIPVYLFFFLLSDKEPTRNLSKHLNFIKAQHRNDVVFLIKEFLSILVAFFRGQILIGVIMGVLMAIGFSIAGLKFGLALGLIIGLLNIVPYLGSILGLSVVLPLAFLQPDGGLSLMLIVLGVFAAVQFVEGWFLTPQIMGHQTGLHPVVIIVAVFFWGQALGGILGMVLAVPLTAFFVTAWRLLRRKYLAAA